MTDKIAEQPIPKQEEGDQPMTRSYTPSQIADGLLAGEFTRDSAFVPLAEVERLTRQRDEARAEVDRLRADHGALRSAAREYLETLGGAMKSGKFEMAGTAEMAHFVRQAMQKLDSLVFDRAGPRPAGLEKLHEPHGRAS